MTGEERDKRLVLAASRGAFVAYIQRAKTLDEAARVFGYTALTFEGDAFETAFEWARQNLEADREQKAQARAAQSRAERQGVR